MLVTKGVEWTDAMDARLEKVYQRFREEFWRRAAEEVGGGVGWRGAEERMWDLGRKRFVRKL
jgi:hypothetical protein